MFIHAGMQVNHSSQWEAWSLRRTGLLPILLITHENGASGCCEDWLFRSPCYFNRDRQWNVLYPRWGCCAGQLLSHGLWSCSLLRGLRRQRPKTARADSPHHLILFFFSKQWGCLFPGIPTRKLERNHETRLSLRLSVWKSWPSRGFKRK